MVPKFFGIFQKNNFVLLTTRQHLHKKSTKFLFRQTNKWIENAYVFFSCKKWSWVLLKSNAHFKQYFEQQGQKDTTAINQFSGFFHIHIFVLFLNGNIQHSNSVYVLLLVSDMTDCCGLQGQKLLLEKSKLNEFERQCRQTCTCVKPARFSDGTMDLSRVQASCQDS